MSTFSGIAAVQAYWLNGKSGSKAPVRTDLASVCKEYGGALRATHSEWPVVAESASTFS